MKMKMKKIHRNQLPTKRRNKIRDLYLMLQKKTLESDLYCPLCDHRSRRKRYRGYKTLFIHFAKHSAFLEEAFGFYFLEGNFYNTKDDLHKIIAGKDFPKDLYCPICLEEEKILKKFNHILEIWSHLEHKHKNTELRVKMAHYKKYLTENIIDKDDFLYCPTCFEQHLLDSNTPLISFKIVEAMYFHFLQKHPQIINDEILNEITEAMLDERVDYFFCVECLKQQTYSFIKNSKNLEEHLKKKHDIYFETTEETMPYFPNTIDKRDIL